MHNDQQIQKVKDYLHTQLRQGAELEHLRINLIQSGWDKSIINEIVQTDEFANSRPAQPTRNGVLGWLGRIYSGRLSRRGLLVAILTITLGTIAVELAMIAIGLASGFGLLIGAMSGASPVIGVIVGAILMALSCIALLVQSALTISFTVRRLHDLGLSGIYSLLLIISSSLAYAAAYIKSDSLAIVGMASFVLVSLWLLLAPGQKKNNHYGSLPEKQGVKYALGIIQKIN